MCNPDGEPQIEDSHTCRAFIAHKVGVRRQSADFYGVPLIFTEFGACFNTERCAIELKNSNDAFDDQLASWNHWMYKNFGDHTTHAGHDEGMFNSDGTTQPMKLF